VYEGSQVRERPISDRSEILSYELVHHRRVSRPKRELVGVGCGPTPPNPSTAPRGSQEFMNVTSPTVACTTIINLRGKEQNESGGEGFSDPEDDPHQNRGV